MSRFGTKASVATDSVGAEDDTPSSVQGRSVFAVETVAAGVSVQTAFLTDGQKMLLAPAVFPDVVYAMNQIDELRGVVLQHFSHAAQVGAKVMAADAKLAVVDPVVSSAVQADKKA